MSQYHLVMPHSAPSSAKTSTMTLSESSTTANPTQEERPEIIKLQKDAMASNDAERHNESVGNLEQRESYRSRERDYDDATVGVNPVFGANAVRDANAAAIAVSVDTASHPQRATASSVTVGGLNPSRGDWVSRERMMVSVDG